MNQTSDSRVTSGSAHFSCHTCRRAADDMGTAAVQPGCKPEPVQPWCRYKTRGRGRNPTARSTRLSVRYICLYARSLIKTSHLDHVAQSPLSFRLHTSTITIFSCGQNRFLRTDLSPVWNKVCTRTSNAPARENKKSKTSSPPLLPSPSSSLPYPRPTAVVPAVTGDGSGLLRGGRQQIRPPRWPAMDPVYPLWQATDLTSPW